MTFKKSEFTYCVTRVACVGIVKGSIVRVVVLVSFNEVSV